MKYIVILIFFLVTLLSAEYQNSNISLKVGEDIPKVINAVPSNIVRNRVESSTIDNKNIYKEAQVRDYQRGLILNQVFDVQILMTPITRLIRAVDSIGISPIYITSIIFPQNMKIVNVQASFAAQIMEYHQNMLRFRPKEDFVTGNIIVTMTDGSKNYTMTIFANRYFQKDCKISSNSYICKQITGEFEDAKSSRRYKYTYDNLSALYVYKNPIKVDALSAMSLYEKLKGRIHIIREKDYVIFKYRNITYKIIKDNRFGTVFYRGDKYRVEASK